MAQVHYLVFVNHFNLIFFLAKIMTYRFVFPSTKQRGQADLLRLLELVLCC
jgi:hypothetical protein